MFPVLKRIKIRQWAPLFSLGMGLLGSWIGGRLGQEASPLWFGAGVVVAVIIVLLTYLRRRRREHRPAH